MAKTYSSDATQNSLRPKTQDPAYTHEYQPGAEHALRMQFGVLGLVGVCVLAAKIVAYDVG